MSRCLSIYIFSYKVPFAYFVAHRKYVALSHSFDASQTVTNMCVASAKAFQCVLNPSHKWKFYSILPFLSEIPAAAAAGGKCNFGANVKGIKFGGNLSR